MASPIPVDNPGGAYGRAPAPPSGDSVIPAHDLEDS